MQFEMWPALAALSFLFQVSIPDEIGRAIDAAKRSGAQALNVLSSSLLFNNRQIILERVATYRLPAIFWATARVLCKFIEIFSLGRPSISCVAASQARFPSNNPHVSN